MAKPFEMAHRTVEGGSEMRIAKKVNRRPDTYNNSSTRKHRRRRQRLEAFLSTVEELFCPGISQLGGT